MKKGNIGVLSSSKYSQYLKTQNLLEILGHLVFWGIITYFFLKNAYLRPYSTFWKEISTIALIAFICYINYFILYPFLFRKNKIGYFTSLLSLILVITALEMLMVMPNIKQAYQSFGDSFIDSAIRNKWILIYCRDLAFLCFFVMLKMYKDARITIRIEKEKALLEQEKQQMEIDLLKSHINPHFLFNNLNKIHNDVENFSEQVSEKVIALAELMRSMIENLSTRVVPLQEEIKFIHNLLLLENDYRYTRLDVKFSYTGLEMEKVNVPPMLFETFISNAFKFVKVEDGFIHIKMRMEGQKELHFLCENNIEKNNTHIVSTKSGIKNIRRRLNLLYPNKYELIVGETGENIFSVHLILKTLYPPL